jgi:hypothetical protein
MKSSFLGRAQSTQTSDAAAEDAILVDISKCLNLEVNPPKFNSPSYFANHFKNTSMAGKSLSL